MSREAMEAVQDHSKITDPMGRHIFTVIGRFVAADTKQGWCSDRTVAELAGVDKDTVGAWRGRLLEAGEIETWTTGAGRGIKRYYRFMLPFDDPKHEASIRDNNELMSLPERDNTNGTISELMSHIENLMSRIDELMSQQAELMSRINVPIVPTRTGQEHHNTKDNTMDHQEDSADGEAEAEPKPYDVFAELLKLEPGMKKGQSLREIKTMLQGNGVYEAYSLADIVGCGAFLQTDPWRVNNMITLSTQHIMEKLPKWIQAGRPVDYGSYQLRQGQNGNGRQVNNGISYEDIIANAVSEVMNDG